MEQRVTQVLLAAIIGLMAWNFSTLNGLQLEVEAMMYKHASSENYMELKSRVDRIQWILQEDALEK